jgi:hypothetical protein
MSKLLTAGVEEKVNVARDMTQAIIQNQNEEEFNNEPRH